MSPRKLSVHDSYHLVPTFIRWKQMFHSVPFLHVKRYGYCCADADLLANKSIVSQYSQTDWSLFHSCALSFTPTFII